MMMFCPLCYEIKESGRRCACSGSKKNRVSTVERGYDWQWTQLSSRIRRIEPLCRRCNKAGRTRPAIECHHIVPIAEAPERRLDASNIMPVCRPCHVELERDARAGVASMG